MRGDLRASASWFAVAVRWFSRTGGRGRPLPSQAGLAALMGRYTVSQLVGVGNEDFERTIRGFLNAPEHQPLGSADEVPQRVFAHEFRWGHDHDFGAFVLDGEMGTRHLRHIAEFVDRFHALPRTLEGIRILDVGCWTGGTSLLLCAMGAQVVAVEEVRRYADCVAYLKRAFGLDGLEVLNRSLYDCTSAEFQDAFDYVLLAGVLYHVTDPILALRITFNALKDGGACLIETTGFAHRRPLISFARRRWNWFDPSPTALRQMLADVGYDDVRLGTIHPDRRLYAVARRRVHVAMRRDGLSNPRVR